MIGTKRKSKVQVIIQYLYLVALPSLTTLQSLVLPYSLYSTLTYNCYHITKSASHNRSRESERRGKWLSQCAPFFGRMVRLSFMDIFQRAAPVKQSTGILSLLGLFSVTAVLSAVACGAGAGELNGLITCKVLLGLLFHRQTHWGLLKCTHTPLFLMT